MLRQTFAYIRELAKEFYDPDRASQAMHDLLCSNMKLSRRTLTKNFLLKLKLLGVGTHDVERYASGVCRQNVRKARNVKLIRDILKHKVDDAKYDEDCARKQFVRSKIIYYKIVKRGSFVDQEFNRVMKYEVEWVWNNIQEKHGYKVSHLLEEYGTDKHEDMRKVKYTDDDLKNVMDNVEDEVIVYDHVELNDDEKAVLKLSPDHMLYDRIDEKKMEVNIECGLMKARYQIMSDKEKEINNNNPNNPTNDDTATHDERGEVFDFTKKTANYANLRATDLPTVQRLIPPKPASLQKEIAMQSMRDKMLRKVKEYKEKKCHKDGNIKSGNLTKSEAKGLKDIGERIKRKEVVIFETDKSSKFTVDTPNNYKQTIQKHTEGDDIIDEETVRKLEKENNMHLSQLNRMFKVGSNLNHGSRIAGASTSTNVPPPPIYGTRKDHKPEEPDQEHLGPDVRPVVGAKEAPNSRLGHFVSKVINHFVECEEDSTLCNSTEDMKAAFEAFNKLDNETKKKCRIVSMDVKALFPSMMWDDIVQAVLELIDNSKMNIDGVNWREVGKYVAVFVPSEVVL